MTTVAATPTPATITPHPVASQFRFNQRTGRYIGSDGRFVPAVVVRQAVDIVIEGAANSLIATAKQFQNGKISLPEWQVQTANQLKLLHVANGLAAVGGSRAASQSDYGQMGNLIKQQYKYLKDFAKDIAGGKQSLDKTFLDRVQMYADAARGTYHTIETQIMKQNGITTAKRILGFADHCRGCVNQADKGWQPIDMVAPIGSQQCLTKCHCSIEYKHEGV